MNRKRRYALFSLLIALLVLTGCGGKENTQVQKDTAAAVATVAAQPTAEATVTPTPEATATPGPEATATPTPEATATPTPEATATPTPEATATPTPEATATPTPEPTATSTPEATATPTPEATATPTPEPTATPTPEPVQVTAAIDANGSYTSKDDVALYIHTYGTLPGNFITKKEAQALGWSGGGLDAYAPGKCIGGDYFGNYEGRLPDGKYHECDIDTLGKSSRGAKRIIYSDTGAIYYTDDHYETFTQLY